MGENQKHSYGLGSRILYGMAEFYGGGAFVIINTFFIVFLTTAIGMPAALAGTIPLVGKIWDAISDPIMGNITDRTKSKFGSKRFYILIGGIVSSATFITMWLSIKSQSMAMLYVFYLFMYCLFSTGFTILMVPYNGLLPDMIDSYAMRSKFSSIRMIWSTLGSMVCGLVPTLIIKTPTDKRAYLQCAVLFGILFLITSMVTFFGTWEKQKEPVKSSLSESFPQAVSVFKSHSFRMFLGLYLFGQCGMDFVSGMAVYYVKEVLNGYENGYFTYLMAVLLLSQLVGMVVFAPIMSSTSKRTTILIGAPIRLLGTLGLLFFSYEGANLIPILVMTAFIGFGNAGTLSAIFAAMADMAEVDELITSIHRPGIVSGMATFARKISSGLSAAAIGFLLSAVGYDSVLANQEIRQSAATQRGIALVYIIVPAILITGLIIVGIIFPITAKEFAVIQKEIARRKGEDTSKTTQEDIAICEKVTGLSYDQLWNKKNATLSKNK
ncbi:MFS transporter [Butyrivibrio proteoclasticus]|uniref:MFS transporter n=1 Tax=Butyrivibrio proteoclasticus TaxID=43305 RepID=UPI00054E70C6|nr:MFS transporter [Butyrivibrio proteoclasticus]